jgi:hypothetical protein
MRPVRIEILAAVVAAERAGSQGRSAEAMASVARRGPQLETLIQGVAAYVASRRVG